MDYQQLSLFDRQPLDPAARGMSDEISMTLDQRRYLTGPLIGHGAWLADIPKWLKDAVLPARLGIVRAESQGGECDLASLEETLAYLFSAAFEAPLSDDYARLFFWTTAQVMSQHGRASSVEEVGQMLGDAGEVAPLSGYQQRELLNPLRRQIRAAVVKHVRQQEKGTRIRHRSIDEPKNSATQ